MKKRTEKIVFSVFMMLLVAFLVASSITHRQAEIEKAGKTVDCYDKEGNRIIGEKCEFEPVSNFSFGIIFAIQMVIVGFIWYIVLDILMSD